jgi:hypothetical protein
MAKKQTRRSISVSRTTYERLKAFCETNGISMSQFVENRVGDFLGEGAANPEAGIGGPLDRAERSSPPRPAQSSTPPLRPNPVGPTRSSTQSALAPIRPQPQPQPMLTSAAARYAIAPPPPIIKKAEQAAPKAPTMPKADQIFTF